MASCETDGVKFVNLKRLAVGLAGSALIVGLSAATASAQTVSRDQWDAFAAQQPFLSQILLAHEASAVAKLLGISVSQLQNEVLGRTIADVAADHGHTADEVIRVMQDTANADVALAAQFGMVSSASREALQSQIDGLVPMLVVTQAPTSYTPEA
jgi:hypothetical protein